MGARTNTRTPHAQRGGHTDVSRAGLTPHPKMWAQPGVRWMGTHRGSPRPRHRNWVCPVPAGSPRGAWTPALTSCTRVVWQFLRSGPCSSTLGAPGCNESIMMEAGGTPCAPSPAAQAGALNDAAPSNPPPAPRSHRGPVDEPVRLLLAVDDDAVALAPLLGCPGRAEAAGRCWHPACPAPRGAPARPLPGAQRCRPCPYSPELFPCLHHHEVPRVVDPLVQEVVVVLGSDR